MLRAAERKDIPELENLAREILPSHPLPDFSFLSDPHYFCVMSTYGGYIFARIDKWNGEKAVLILSTAARHSVPRIDRILGYKALEIWSRERKIPKILAMTKTPEVFLKRWGFRLESFVISKEVK